jgi:acyl-CoA reductase-like NAD-dependent aldehyde dehydrogenase
MARAKVGKKVAKNAEASLKHAEPALVRVKVVAEVDRSLGSSRTLERVTVNKAYKMYIGGAFVRSESGRSFAVKGAKSTDPEVVNMPRGSRKDVRDAVLVAKNAQAGWSARTPFNRGQILYRLAEMMESRRSELAMSLGREGLSPGDAAREVQVAIDRCVYYSGMCDKLSALLASHNPVSGPHFGFTLPESLGVVGVVSAKTPSLLGLVSAVVPVIAGGNAVVAIVAGTDPRTAAIWTECLATSDLPGGVVNVIYGQVPELVPHLAKHREVSGLSLWGDLGEVGVQAESSAADSVKRVRRYLDADRALIASEDGARGLGYVEPFLEFKTVWHPMGM